MSALLHRETIKITSHRQRIVQPRHEITAKGRALDSRPGGRAAVAFEFQSRALLHFDVYIMWPLHDAQSHRRRRCCLRNAAVTRTSSAVTQWDMTGRSVRTTGPRRGAGPGHGPRRAGAGGILLVDSEARSREIYAINANVTR